MRTFSAISRKTVALALFTLGLTALAQAADAPPKDAIILFDGKDFSKFEGDKGKPVQWKIVEGDAMEVTPKSGSIVTKQTFADFHLHGEFRIPYMPDAKGQGRGNSGFYLQRRYEVQILDSYGLELKPNDCGSIYTIKAPDVNVCKKPLEWQTYEIIFRAARFEGEGKDAKKVENARITVIHNGRVIHNNFIIPNKTGAGQAEGPEPGPILLQDHGNTVQFRNLWIVPLDKKEEKKSEDK